MFRYRWIKGRVCLVLLLLLFFTGTPAWGRITDVPPGHWAYQAVKKLVDEGYLQLYNDGTFRGNFPVDRFTLASVVAKLLAQMGDGTIPGEVADAQLLRNLTNEFRSELVLLAAKDAELAERLRRVEEKQLVLAEDLTKTSDEFRRLNQQLSGDILQETIQLADLLKRHENELEKLNKEIEKERRKNRTYMIVVGLVGLLAGYSMATAN